MANGVRPEGGGLHNEAKDTVADVVVQAGTIVIGNAPLARERSLRTPRKVPPSVVWFANRFGVLGCLDAVLVAPSGRGGVRVVQVRGLTGIGKTEIGFRWANSPQAVESYPDGQLYADLGRRQGSGVAAMGEVVGGLLRDLGVPPEDVPNAAEQRLATYRRVTRDLRLLVVADDPHDAEQVEWLVPGPRGAVVVTSGVMLEGLARRHRLSIIDLPPLDAEGGAALLAGMLDDGRVAAEPLAVAELVRLCDGLPIAVHAAGCRLRARPELRVSSVVADLASPETLARLTVDGFPLVQRFYDEVYRELPRDARRFYRCLGALPGPRFGPTAAAAAAALTTTEAARLIDRLRTPMLLQPDNAGPDVEDYRYVLGPLVHLHARRQAEAEAGEFARAVREVIRWYVAAVTLADHAQGHDRLRLPESTAPATGLSFASAHQALAWCDAEQENLLAVIRAAADHGCDQEVCWLCQALSPYYVDRRHHASATLAYRLGVEAAQRLGDRAMEARIRSQLARPYFETGLFEEARKELADAEAAASEALAAARRDRTQAPAGRLIGDAERLMVRLGASVLELRGRCAVEENDFAAAREALHRSIAMNTSIGNTRGTAIALYNLGRAEDGDGDPARGIELLNRARAMFTTADDRLLARMDTALAAACLHARRYDDAERAAIAAAEAMAARGSHAGCAAAAEILAECLDHNGRTEEARKLLGYVVGVYQEVASPRAIATATRLAHMDKASE